MATKKAATKPKTRQASDTEVKVKLLVNRNGGDNDIVIEIPATWRVTFGYVNPNKSSDGYRSNEGHCLRVYEGEKLRAVFGNVRGFRDLDIPLASKHQKESGSATWERDSDGNFEASEKKQIESSFEEEEVEEISFA